MLFSSETCLFLYLVIPDTQEAKQQKATEIASRLLKELAGENLPTHPKEATSTNEDNKDAVKSAEPSAVESNPMASTDDNDNEDDDNTEMMPSIEDLYQLYNGEYAQQADEDEEEDNNEESLSEMNDDDYILPISEQQWMQYLAEQQESKSAVMRERTMLNSFVLLSSGRIHLTSLAHTHHGR